MGRRGPPPQPTKLRLLLGNRGKRPINKREPKLIEGSPDMPAWLTGEAKAEWGRLAGELHDKGLLAIADRAALAACCQAWAEFVECTRTLKREGRILKEPLIATVKNRQTGEKEFKVVGYRRKAHPIVRMQRDAFSRLKSFLAEFGLTPASRASVQATPRGEAVDQLQEILNRGKTG